MWNMFAIKPLLDELTSPWGYSAMVIYFVVTAWTCFSEVIWLTIKVIFIDYYSMWCFQQFHSFVVPTTLSLLSLLFCSRVQCYKKKQWKSLWRQFHRAHPIIIGLSFIKYGIFTLKLWDVIKATWSSWRDCDVSKIIFIQIKGMPGSEKIMRWHYSSVFPFSLVLYFLPAREDNELLHIEMRMYDYYILNLSKMET